MPKFWPRCYKMQRYEKCACGKNGCDIDVPCNRPNKCVKRSGHCTALIYRCPVYMPKKEIRSIKIEKPLPFWEWRDVVNSSAYVIKKNYKRTNSIL